MRRKKILFGSIFVLTLILLIPSIPAIKQYKKDVDDNSVEPLDLIGRKIIRGFGFFPHFQGDNLTFFVIRFDTGSEVVWFKWITLQSDIRLFISYNIGRFNYLIYIIGFYQGEILVKPAL